MEKKYNLTEHSKIFNGKLLHRIQALKDFGDVKAGDIGGWVEGEHNLDIFGNCWIYDNSIAMGKSIVCGESKICNNSIIHNSAKICRNAIINNTIIGKRAMIGQNGYILSQKDYIETFKLHATFYLDKDRNIWIRGMGFNYPLEDYKQQMKDTFKQNIIKKHMDIIKKVEHELQ